MRLYVLRRPTAEVPLLYDDYEETGDAGIPLQFTVIKVNDDEEDWPDPASCVVAIRQRDAAFTAARLLVDLYQRCDLSGEFLMIERGDIEEAYRKALAATTSQDRPS